MDPLLFTAQCCDKVLSAAELVRGDLGVTAVHALRVACRRLSQAIELLEDLIDGDTLKRARKASSGLRRLFGAIRDADVLLQLIQRNLQDIDRSMSELVASAHLVTMLAERRRASSHEALAAIDGPEARQHLDTLRALAELCLALNQGAEEADEVREAPDEPRRGQKKHSGASVLKAIRVRRAKLDALINQGPLEPTPEGLELAHTIRIAFKSYRYSVEAYAIRLSPEDELALLETFKVVQDSLGEVQDAAVLLGNIDRVIRDLPAPESLIGLDHVDLHAGFDRIREALIASTAVHLAALSVGLERANAALDASLPPPRSFNLRPPRPDPAPTQPRQFLADLPKPGHPRQWRGPLRPALERRVA